MNTCLKALVLATSVSAVSVDTDEEIAFPVQLMQSVHNHQYHIASSYDKVVSQTPELWNLAPCQYWYNDSWYNLIGTSFDTTAYFTASTSTGDQAAYFTMCQQLKQTNLTQCSNLDGEDYAVLDQLPIGSDCEALSTSNTDSITQTEYQVVAGSDTQTLGLLYNNTVNGCSLEVGLICAKDMSSGTYTTTDLVQIGEGDSCQFKTTMSSKNNCAVYELPALFEWLNQYTWLWGAFAIIIGFFLGLFGQKLFSITLFIIGTFTTVVLIWLLFYSTFLSDSTEEWVGWTVLGCSVLLGLLGGFLLYKCQRLGATIVGGAGGFFLGMLFSTTVLWAAQSEIAFWIINVSFCLIAAALSYIFYYHAVIISTSFLGSFLFIRGISMYAGGYPQMSLLIAQIEAGALDHIEYWFYLYLFFMIVCGIICCIVQYRHFKKGVENGDYDSNGHPKHPYDSKRTEGESSCCCF